MFQRKVFLAAFLGLMFFSGAGWSEQLLADSFLTSTVFETDGRVGLDEFKFADRKRVAEVQDRAFDILNQFDAPLLHLQTLQRLYIWQLKTKVGELEGRKKLLARLQEKVNDPLRCLDYGFYLLLETDERGGLEFLERAATLVPNEPEYHLALGLGIAQAEAFIDWRHDQERWKQATREKYWCAFHLKEARRLAEALTDEKRKAALIKTIDSAESYGTAFPGLVEIYKTFSLFKTEREREEKVLLDAAAVAGLKREGLFIVNLVSLSRLNAEKNLLAAAFATNDPMGFGGVLVLEEQEEGKAPRVICDFKMPISQRWMRPRVRGVQVSQVAGPAVEIEISGGDFKLLETRLLFLSADKKPQQVFQWKNLDTKPLMQADLTLEKNGDAVQSIYIVRPHVFLNPTADEKLRTFRWNQEKGEFLEK